VKLKFHDFTRTTVERAGLPPTLDQFQSFSAEVRAHERKVSALSDSECDLPAVEEPDSQLPLL